MDKKLQNCRTKLIVTNVISMRIYVRIYYGLVQKTCTLTKCVQTQMYSVYKDTFLCFQTRTRACMGTTCVTLVYMCVNIFHRYRIHMNTCTYMNISSHERHIHTIALTFTKAHRNKQEKCWLPRENEHPNNITYIHAMDRVCPLECMCVSAYVCVPLAWCIGTYIACTTFSKQYIKYKQVRHSFLFVSTYTRHSDLSVST